MIVLDAAGERVDQRGLRIGPDPLRALLVLLDRDGTILEPRPGYVLRDGHAVFLPGALDALRRLAALDVATVIVTNQPAIGRGLVAEGDALAIHRRVLAEAAAAGARIGASFICPHAPADRCACRKPKTAMLDAARAATGMLGDRTVMVGDADCDMAAAVTAGVMPVRVRAGFDVEAVASLERLTGARAPARV